MAKYVLVAFDDDNVADQFVKEFDPNGYVPGDLGLPGRVVAEFKKPTQFCRCTPEQKRGTVGVTGSKFGWFVCGRCKKPKEGGGQCINNLYEADKKPWEKIFRLQVR